MPMPATCLGSGRVTLLGMLVLAGCATTPSLDMSDGPIESPGQDIGIVIGSVLVQIDQEPSEPESTQSFGRKASGFVYDFGIVKATGLGGVHPADEGRYELEVKPAVERIFVARLPFGRYVFNSVRYKGVSLLSGELGLNFVVAPRATLYIGRLVLKLPPRVTLGTPYTVEIQNAREATIGALQTQHPGLGQDAVDALIQNR